MADPKTLCVRARATGDLERVFPCARVQSSPAREYAYRAFIDRAAVAAALAAAVERIDYTNFKASVTEQDRHDAYLGCWFEMSSFQQARRDRP